MTTAYARIAAAACAARLRGDPAAPGHTMTSSATASSSGPSARVRWASPLKAPAAAYQPVRSRARPCPIAASAAAPISPYSAKVSVLVQ